MSTTVASALLSPSAASFPSTGVWSRLFQQFAPRSPRISRFLPKVKTGRFLLEIGQPAEWKTVDVVLAGASLDDLGLYYYEERRDRQQSPLGRIPLHAAHIDTLEEVLMVVTADKTWFLCADHARDASDWASEICSTIGRVADAGSDAASLTGDDLNSQSPRSPLDATAKKQQNRQRQRLSSSASAATLRELQSRDAKSRVDEFLEIFVRCSASGARAQALKGALSWSCVRNIAWKIWLDYIPGDLQIRQWAPIVRDKRRHYAVERKHFSALRDSVAGLVGDEEFVASCEASQDTLLHDIYKDVRRTRGHMGFFRGPQVQALMIRVLYTYSKAHPAVSYNQGMSELLATIVYLLHIEQWPTGSETQGDADVAEDKHNASQRDAEPGSSYDFFVFMREQSAPRLRTRSTEKLGDLDEKDASYVYVESFLGLQNGDSNDGDAFLDRDALLRLPAFSGAAGNYYECCRDAAEEVVRELTLGAFIEHDAYGLLEEMMLRMAGTFCPDVVVVPIDLATTNEHVLKRSQQQHQRRRPRHGSPSGVSHSSRSAELSASPLYEQMNRIHHHILRRCDPPTARCLSQLGVEPQMFLLRWVRVLMAREFELAQVWRIWDAIFSLTPSDFSFINLLCAAVVQAFRDDIERAEDATSVLLALRDVSDRIAADRLVNTARELYDALLIAAAAEATESAMA